MSAPGVPVAEQLLAEAEALNPGAWVAHSRHVAEAAARLAAPLPGLDPAIARSLGLLHDIGRRAGVSRMRHIVDGYDFLVGLGYERAARIALTHSFPIRDIRASIGEWDVTPAQYDFVRRYLEGVVYDDYDRLLQLCDALALPEGFCLLEKRFVDVTLRHGVYPALPERWQATLAIKAAFEIELGRSIYAYLPGVVATTFGAADVT